MQGYPVWDLLNWLIQAILVCTYVYILTDEWRFSRKVTAVLFLVFGIIAALLAGTVLLKYGVTQQAKMRVAVCVMGLGTFLALYVSRYQDGRAVFICFSAITFSLAGVLVGEVVGSASTVARLLVKIVIYIIGFVFIYSYFRPALKRLMKEMSSGWHRMAMVPVSSSLLCLFFLMSEEVYHDKNLKLIALLLVLSIACTYITLYHIFCILQKQYRNRANYALLDSQMEFLQKQMETVRSANERLRIFRHDIRHYIAIQLSCLENNNMEEAREILVGMKEKLDHIEGRPLSVTGSPFIDVVLADYEERAKKAEIRLSVQMSIPKNADMEYLELAVVLSNALENAWKACLKIPEGKERAIYVTGRQDRKQYFLEISNTYFGEICFNEDHTVPVASEKGHGCGTRSIIAFAEKYSAYVDFKEEGGLFKVRLIFASGCGLAGEKG